LILNKTKNKNKTPSLHNTHFINHYSSSRSHGTQTNCWFIRNFPGNVQFSADRNTVYRPLQTYVSQYENSVFIETITSSHANKLNREVCSILNVRSEQVELSIIWDTLFER